MLADLVTTVGFGKDVMVRLFYSSEQFIRLEMPERIELSVESL